MIRSILIRHVSVPCRQADAESIQRQVELEADIQQKEDRCMHVFLSSGPGRFQLVMLKAFFANLP